MHVIIVLGPTTHFKFSISTHGALFILISTQTQKMSFRKCKRKLCPLDEVTTDRRHKDCDWEKCPIKNLCATSAPWTVQCIYQCHQASKATDISEAWCGTWPLTCTDCRQIWEGADSQTKPEFLFTVQHSALKQNTRGILHFVSMQKRRRTKFHLFCTKKLIYVLSYLNTYSCESAENTYLFSTDFKVFSHNFFGGDFIFQSSINTSTSEQNNFVIVSELHWTIIFIPKTKSGQLPLL